MVVVESASRVVDPPEKPRGETRGRSGPESDSPPLRLVNQPPRASADPEPQYPPSSFPMLSPTATCGEFTRPAAATSDRSRELTAPSIPSEGRGGLGLPRGGMAGRLGSEGAGAWAWGVAVLSPLRGLLQKRDGVL